MPIAPDFALSLLLSFAPAPSTLASGPADPVEVVGGQAASTCQWPTTVSLVYGGGGSCTGTLIHPQVVVFAAHCSPSLGQVRLGETADSPARVVPVESCRAYPGYAFEVGIDDWAFCRLAEPVTDVPITPPLMGCETDLLTKGREVVVAGFGMDNAAEVGVKRWAWTTVAETPAADADDIRVGGNGVGPCSGDSGGPAYVRLEDGSWHAFGILSGGASCGGPMRYMQIHRAMQWFESESGIDLTPCHDGDGTWNPGPKCGGFASAPLNTGSSWADGCSTGVSGPAGTCGDPYHTEDDTDPATVEIVTPLDQSVYPDAPASLDIHIEADDGTGWGVRRVWLDVDGVALGYAEDEPLYDGVAPYVYEDVKFPEGVYELRAHAEDFAGHLTQSQPVTLAVGTDLPEPPPGDDDEPTGSGTGGAGTGGENPEGSTGGGAPDADDVGGAGTGSAGCSCRSGPAPASGVMALLFLLLGVGARSGGRRRPRKPRPVPTASLVVLLAAVPSTALAQVDTPPASPEPIAGGENAQVCAWPTVAGIYNGVSVCSATLVHPRLVVYAAHCGTGASVAHFGDAESGPSMDVAVETCRTNPDFGNSQARDWAFCVLSEPVDLPVTPITFGCETDLIQPGQEVALVGFGVPGLGTKAWTVTEINDVQDAVVSLGGGGVGACSGDSGGPALLQYPDGSWHAFGIASTSAGCGGESVYARMDRAVEWIEQASGIDVTPCHDPDGTWNPGPACGGFLVSGPEGHGTWADVCAGTPSLGASATCGPPFDEVQDVTPPQVWIRDPEDGESFDMDSVVLEVAIEADDEGSGVAVVRLEIDGELQDLTDMEAPWEFSSVQLAKGSRELVAVAEDRAGNLARSETVTLEVGAETPVPPDEGQTDGATGGSGDLPPLMPDEEFAGACTCRSGGATGPIGWCCFVVVLSRLARPRRPRFRGRSRGQRRPTMSGFDATVPREIRTRVRPGDRGEVRFHGGPSRPESAVGPRCSQPASPERSTFGTTWEHAPDRTLHCSDVALHRAVVLGPGVHGRRPVGPP